MCFFSFLLYSPWSRIKLHLRIRQKVHELDSGHRARLEGADDLFVRSIRHGQFEFEMVLTFVNGQPENELCTYSEVMYANVLVLRVS